MTTLREFAGLSTGNIGLLLDAVPDPMIVTHVDGSIVRLSDSAVRLLGYSNDDLLGRPLADLISEELRDDYVAHREAFLAGGGPPFPELETRFVIADGTVLPIDASVGGLHLDGIAYVMLVMRVVSDRLATQTRLERLVAIDELTTSISSRLNTPDSDAIDRALEESVDELALFCNASAAYLFTESQPGSWMLHSRSRGGHDQSAVVVLGLDELPWVRELLEIASISKVTTSRLTEKSAADCLLLAAEGVASLVVIPLRASGRTIGFVGIESTDQDRPPWPGDDLAGLIVLQDVFENAVERKRIGSELRRVNRVLQAVSECHDALIRAQDEKELLRDVCRIVVEAGGYSLAWVGYPLDNEAKDIEAQAQWGDDDGYVANLELHWREEGEGLGPAGETIRTRQPFLVRDTATDPGLSWHSRPNSYGYLSMVTVPVFNGDEVAGMLCVYDRQVDAFDGPALEVLKRFADDLAFGIAALRSRKRQVEAESKLRELLESKDDLIVTIAHELRTPLAGVVGFAQVLREEGESLDSESRAEMIRLVAEQAMDLTNIVDDLLVAAKSEAGTLQVASLELDLRSQAAQVLDAWGSGVFEGIDVSGPPAPTVGDPARVRQILRNLLTNALRYGGEQIDVHVGVEDGVVCLRVEDNGEGVEAGDHDRIFEPYRRAHDAPGVTASMGLGLAISRQLARRMGGDLAYRNVSGRSVFILTMPALQG